MSTPEEALDRVRDLLYDWGQDFASADDETMKVTDVLEDLWSAIAGMPEGTKVRDIPSRAPVVCPHLRSTQPAFAEQWNRLWSELTDLRAARDRLRAVCELADQIGSAFGGGHIIATADVRDAAGIETPAHPGS